MAEKTSEQIERDVFRIIRDSELKDLIGGSIYRDGMRPKNAQTEDIVVKFLTGIDGQEQSGVVLVHIYVPNSPSPNNDGETVKDTKRIDQLEDALNGVISSLENVEYWFEKDGTPQSYPVEDIEQYFINARIHYRRKTF